MSDASSLAEQLMEKHSKGSSETSSESNERPAASSRRAGGKFDIGSMEAFPSLGRSPAAPNGSPKSTLSWGKDGSPSGSGPSSPALNSQGFVAARSGDVSEVFTLDKASQNPNASQLLAETLRKVRSFGDVRVNSSTSKVSGNIAFEVRGAREVVQRVRRELLRGLSAKVQKKIAIPASARAAIIGPKGATLRPIIERTGTQINIAKDDGQSRADDDDESEPTVEVSIEGDGDGVRQAVASINAIVADKVRDLTTKIKTIDSKFYPFIIGPKGTNLEQLVSNKEVKVTVPTASSENTGIVVSGERNAVLEVKTTIEQFVADIDASYSTQTVRIPALKHRFVNSDEIFDGSGVTVEFVADSDRAVLFGPRNKLKAAQELLEKQAGALSVLSLDISKAHGKSIPHAINLVRYFAHSKKLAPIERSNSVKISYPTQAELLESPEARQDVTVELVGTDVESIKEAKKAVVTLVNSLPPSRVGEIADLDPFFYSHIRKASKQVGARHGVVFIVPDDSKTSQKIVVVYEGADGEEEDFAPGDDEIRAKIAEAVKSFDDVHEKQKTIISKVVSVPAANHKYIVGPNGTTLNALLKGHSASDSDPLVTIYFGANHQAVAGYSDSLNLDKDSVWIRGIKPEVDRIASEIDDVIEESKDYETASNYTTEFTFPKEHLSQLIGRQGANVTKLREEYGVKIEVDEEGNGLVKGIKKNADEARARILALGHKVVDEVLLRIDAPNEHHPTLIGQGGKFVKRLEDKYDVRIRFPRSDNSSGRDAPNGKDEVTVRGPKRGAAKAKEELLELLNYEVEHGYTETIMVPSKAVPRVIGRQGETINDIRDSTGTRIEFQREAEAAAGDKDDADVPLTITGTKTGVKKAVELVRATAQDVIDTVTEVIAVDPKYHKWLIGPGGSVMREITRKASGAPASDDSNLRMIDIPPAGSQSSDVKVTGNKKIVAKILKSIKEIVQERESQSEQVVAVPVDKHGSLIGAGGLVKRDLENDFGVSIAIPRMGSGDENIVVTGKQEDVEKAKIKIAEITTSAHKTDVAVPKDLHRALSATMNRFKQGLDVRIEFGRDASKIPANPRVPAEAIGESLITDEDNEIGTAFKWTVVEDSKDAAQDKATVVWKIRGNEQQGSESKKRIEKAIEELSDYDRTGYLWLGDASRYRLIVGAGGSRINKIRADTGCTITVPKGSDSDGVVTIRGKGDRLDKAKKLVLDSLKANKSAN